ncbi:AMP-binding protein [Bradyrhizobium tropiciagri]|uniref:class I adenylate-forming enzyme family protein n=1 Tax=Bradyrhizobium tropiciagri TaxID=312253 RepID=UPI001BAD2AA6|nr:AMP-binding protein [Bradyrhizobium tropiciagri]MBR0898951.1 AMP-binding protein [Bradyrhizobium tropiciagri]
MTASATVEQARPEYFDVSSRVAEHARLRPNSEALVFEERRLDWQTLNGRINRLANLLIERGVRPGDRVALLASHSAEYVEIFLGTLRAGGCIVPLSPMASADQLAEMIADSGAKVLFLSEGLQDMAAAFPADLLPLRTKSAVAIGFVSPGWAAYEQLMTGVSDRNPGVIITPDMDFNIIYSSGTTGVPKGIVHDHGTRTMTLDQVASLGYGPGCRTLIATPLYSNLTIAAFLPTVALGGTMTLMRKFDTTAYLDVAERERITHAMLVPVQYQRLLADPSFAKRDLSSFQIKFCTSAPLHSSLKLAIVERWPGVLLEIYGMTEGGGVCILNATANRDKLNTVGQPAFGAEFKILDEAGRELPQGEIGEIVSRGKVMMKGYHNRQSATDEFIWKDSAGGRFFKTGDMGYFDQDGFLHLSDRKKDMIISGGFNIYATDLENVLQTHPDVVEGAVIAAPSEEWGETPLAFVVLRPGAQSKPEEIRKWTNERLGKAQRISEVVLMESLPRSPVGKVLKRELRRPYLERAMAVLERIQSKT